jgi:sugar/nucleoside kinase (ribokinase family)
MIAPGRFAAFRLPEHLASRPRDLVVIGTATVEQIVQVAWWPNAGGQENVPITRLALTTGGCGANVACFTGRAGGRVALIARVGTGENGKLMWEELLRSGVQTSFIRRLPNKDGDFIIILTSVDGDWTVLTRLDPDLTVRPEDVPVAPAFEETKFLHVDGFSAFSDTQKQAVERAIALARQAGALVSVDSSVPQAQIQPDYLASLLAQADIAFANEFEAMAATGAATLPEAVVRFQTLGPAVSVIKRGREGSLVVTHDQVSSVPAYSVDVVDTVAAGDAYIALTLLSLARGESLHTATLRGSAAGALACLGPGSLSSRFTLEDIEALIHTGQIRAIPAKWPMPTP